MPPLLWEHESCPRGKFLLLLFIFYQSNKANYNKLFYFRLKFMGFKVVDCFGCSHGQRGWRESYFAGKLKELLFKSIIYGFIIKINLKSMDNFQS